METTIRLSRERAHELLNEHLPLGIRAINVRAPVHSGLSGATVWQIDLQSEGAAYNGFAVAKFDDYDRLRLERDRTVAARVHDALAPRVPMVLSLSPAIAELDEGGNPHSIGFLLSTYAQHKQAEHIDSLQEHIARHKWEHRGRITDQVGALVEPLFRKWYGSVGWTGTRRQLDVPEAVRGLLNIGGEDRLDQLDERMRAHFGLAPDAQLLLIHSGSAGHTPLQLENPAYVLRNAALWEGHALMVASCPMHGDLHGGNVICQVERSGERPPDAAPHLIDFANHSEEGVFFYDLAQLELDILSSYLPHESDEDWRDWLNLLAFIGAEALVPEDDPHGERAPHAWGLIKPIREFVQRYVEETKENTAGGAAVELERTWWLVAAAVGLRAAQRERAAPGVRSAGLVYAGLALRHLPHHRLPDPNAVALVRWFPGHGLNTAPPTGEASVPASTPSSARSPRLHTPHDYKIKTAFVGRAHELGALDRWAASDSRVLEFVAVGGQGKSALTWQWFTSRAATAIPGFAGGLWWSFYESDGSMILFVASALRLLGGTPAEVVERMGREEREDALVDLCRLRPLLLVFDGLERILNSYRSWRASTQTDEEVEAQLAEAGEGGPAGPRACYNPQDGALLRRLAAAGAGRILVTTRLAVADLEDELGKALPGVEPRELKGLSDEDVLALFHHYDITGSSWQIVDFARSFESHGLLLALIASRIRNYPHARGDFDSWYADEGHHLDLGSLDLKQKRNHILRFALEALTPSARDLLRRLAVFNYPFPFDAVMAIHVFSDHHYVAPELPVPPFSTQTLKRKRRASRDAQDAWMRAPSGSSEESDAADRRAKLISVLVPYSAWQAECHRLEQAARREAHEAARADVNAALSELDDRGLIAYNYDRRVYDMHPVVRGYAYNELGDDPSGRSAALAGMQDYFESRETMPPERVRDLDDIRRELEIYDALLQAGQLDRASDFYGTHLKTILHYRLAAYHEIVRLVTPLFRDGLGKYPALSDPRQQAWRIGDLAGAYRHIDPDQVPALMALEVRRDLDIPDAEMLADSLITTATISSDQRRYGSAVHALQLGLRLTHAMASRQLSAYAQVVLCDVHTSLGRWDDAAAARAAVNLADVHEDMRAIREGELKRNMAEALIARGEAVGDLLADAERLARTAGHPLSLRSLEETRGEAALRLGNAPVAVRHFERLLESVHQQRLGARAVLEARGGLARAMLLNQDYRGARAQIDAGADSLSSAEVLLALGEHQQAEKAALAAYEKLWGEGAPYAHRDLPRAEAVLASLGVPPPALPLFDEARVRLPEEDRIIALIGELETEKGGKDAEWARPTTKRKRKRA